MNPFPRTNDNNLVGAPLTNNSYLVTLDELKREINDFIRAPGNAPVLLDTLVQEFKSYRLKVDYNLLGLVMNNMGDTIKVNLEPSFSGFNNPSDNNYSPSRSNF